MHGRHGSTADDAGDSGKPGAASVSDDGHVSPRSTEDVAVTPLPQQIPKAKDNVLEPGLAPKSGHSKGRKPSTEVAAQAP